jgi:endoglucanase
MNSPSETVTRNHLQLLKELTEAVAVAGDEEPIRKIVRREVERYADEVKVDALGNVLARRRARGRRRMRVMLAAHMDEVGFILVAAEADGTFRFDRVGGVDPRQLPAKPVWVGRNRVPGVIGAKPIHLSTAEERKRPLEIDGLRIDLGLDTREAAQAKAQVGERGTFATAFQRLGPTIRGKALDNRLGVAALIELLRYPPTGIELWAAFTVQEEIGLRGAAVAAHAVDPQVSIVLDCAAANDLPTWDGDENPSYNTRLGMGPALTVADRMTIGDPRLVQLATGTAERLQIPFQLRQPGGGTTDAAEIHLAREGIPTLAASVPCRYPHTPASIASLTDWRNLQRLVHAVLVQLEPSTVARRSSPGGRRKK